MYSLPISISSSLISNTGLPTPGNIQEFNATPILLTFCITLFATSLTSINVPSFSALAPAIL